MKGMEIMMKSFGIDPDAIKKVAEQAQALLSDFDKRLTEIDRKVDLLLSLQNGEIPAPSIREDEKEYVNGN